AQEQAAQAAKTAPSDGNAAQLLEELELRIEQLTDSRGKTLANLSDERANLAHLEDHSRRLRRQLAELEAAQEQFVQAQANDEQRRNEVRRQLTEMEVEIAAAEQRAEEAKAAARN